MELDLTEILNDWGGCADDMKSTLGYVFFSWHRYIFMDVKEATISCSTFN